MADCILVPVEPPVVRVRVVIDSFNNGASWYRVYDDKWCEQGGTSNVGTINLLKHFIDTNYTAIGNISSKAKNSFYLGTAGGWLAKGYIN